MIFLVVYRKLKEEEQELYYRMSYYAFRLHEGEKEFKKDDYWKTIGEIKGLFDNQKLVTCYVLYNFDCRLRGNWFKTGGLGDVVSPPENRRKGYIGKMLTSAIEDMRDQGMALSALWPFSYSFYRKYGWEQATAFRSYKLEPDNLKFTDKYPSGDFRKVGLDEWQLLNDVFQKAYRKYELEIKRNQEWWQERVLKMGKQQRYIYLWEKDGEARGYIVYSVKKTSENLWERELVVDELMTLDFEAYRQLLRFLYYHDSQLQEIIIPAPLNDPLIKLIPDPRIKENKYIPGAMFRIIDLKKLLDNLTYPDIKKKITLNVNDKQAPWNNGNFLLEVENGKGNLTRLGSATQADFSININYLVTIITGFTSPSEAYYLKYLQGQDEEKLQDLELLFPVRESYFKERF